MGSTESRLPLIWFRKPLEKSTPARADQILLYYSAYLLLVLVALPFFSVSRSFAQADQDLTDPKLLSIFPLGGRRGATVQVEVWGNLLAGCHSVWFETGGLRGKLLTVEEVKGKEKENAFFLGKKLDNPRALYRARVEVEIEPTAPLRVHSLRLIGLRGISDVVPFRVLDERVFQETTSPHQTVKDALPVDIPVVINGRLEKPGELDYYSFHAKRDQELTFELILAQNCNPQLAVYRAGGSWFDPDRLSRLLAQEQKSSDLIPLQALGTYRFLQDGVYFLEVSSLFGKGSSGNTYQVRVASRGRDSQYETQLEQPPGEWPERNFGRKLEGNWLASLVARAVDDGGKSARGMREPSLQASNDNTGSEQEPTSGLNLPVRLSSVAEREPNDLASQGQDISIPSIVEGSIGRASDIDSFKIKVEAGQKLAFEIETPDAKRPHFNPRLGVVDSQDRELLSNVERRLSLFNNNSDPQVFLKGMEPKVVYSFERGGEYIVQVRDITSRYGSPSYRYKVLIRPQIPHVGAVSVMESDRINLIRGEPKKLTIVASYEEGFRGDVSFAFSRLPEGVQAFPAAEFAEGKAPREVTQDPDVISPKQQKTTVILLASPGAPLTVKPSMVQLHCWPSVKGKLGPNLMVQELPLMVIDGVKEKKEEKQPLGR